MKPKRMIARYMTMMELLIGMALASVLMIVLTQFYSQVSYMNVVSEQKQKESFKERYVEHRLSTVLPKALEKVSKKVYFFTTGDLNGLLADNSPGLVFVFKAGASEDPLRSGNVLGLLYLDKQNRLCLATWPEPKDWDKETTFPLARNEVLMEGVEQLQFSFYAPPNGIDIYGETVFTRKRASQRKSQTIRKSLRGSSLMLLKRVSLVNQRQLKLTLQFKIQKTRILWFKKMRIKPVRILGEQIRKGKSKLPLKTILKSSGQRKGTFGILNGVESIRNFLR